MGRWVLTFFLAGALDFIWATYTMHINAKRACQAGLYAVAIYAAGGLTVILYTADHWLLIPASIGAFLGTYSAIKLEV